MEEKEPSVLDFIKSILNPWSKDKIAIPPVDDIETEEDQYLEENPLSVSEEIIPASGVLPKEDGVTLLTIDQKAPMAATEEQFITTAQEIAVAKEPKETRPSEPRPEAGPFPWRSLLALVFAIMAQRLLEPSQRVETLGIALYVFAGLLLIWAFWRKDWRISPIKSGADHVVSNKVRVNSLIVTVILLVASFLAFGSHRFNGVNLTIWILAIFLSLRTFWQPSRNITISSAKDRFSAWLKHPNLRITLSPFTFLLAGVCVIVVFFRFYQLPQILGEMFSDHAEKLLDVSDVLNGQFSVFFPRNTGREAIQMYLTAAVALVCGTGLSFMSLKIGTVLAGLLTLPYIYLLGKEIGNRWVGLLALFLAGIAYWPNVISRVGLRFPLYPLFVAPCLFYLIRGLRNSNRNDLLLSGLALGIGLHGYSPIRFLPFVVALGVVIYLLHRESKGKRSDVIISFALLAFIALVVFVPLLRYWVDVPEMFGYRAFTRLGTTERPFPAPVWQIFLGNLWKAMIMFFWDNGNIWVHSVTNRPALDIVSAALLFLGILIVVLRYIRDRNWVDIFLLVSIPMLMMPSILSLAFPDENPSLNRTGGAIIPVFILVAIALESLISNIMRNAKTAWRIGFGTVLVCGLLAWSINQNYDLVFRQYNEQFMGGAWNTSDMGRVIKGFSDSVGNLDTAYVVPYPYWVDTRLVGINAGNPLKDYALWPENFETTLGVPGAKLFIVKPEDQASIDQLTSLYPEGYWKLFDSKQNGKDFWIFLVPPRDMK